MAVPGSPEPGSRRIIDMAPIRVETESTTRFRTTKKPEKSTKSKMSHLGGEEEEGSSRKMEHLW